jgi:predicted Rossmann-fold nucleotide-binding protein
MRKLWFSHLARALVVFPGGFGTLDELMEVLTLSQTHKLARQIPVVLYGMSFWHEIINFDALVRYGMVGPEDVDLFQFADDPVTALKLLQAGIRREPEAEEKKPALAHSRDAEG